MASGPITTNLRIGSNKEVTKVVAVRGRGDKVLIYTHLWTSYLIANLELTEV